MKPGELSILLICAIVLTAGVKDGLHSVTACGARWNGNASGTTLQSSMDIHSSSGYILANPREMTANYSYVVTATGTSFQISIHTVQSFSYCNVTKTMVYVRPDRPFTQSTTIDELGNDVLTIKVQSLNVLGRFTITVLQHLTVYSVAYQIDPNGVGSYDTASELYRTYTKATQYIESDHPEMIAKSKEIVGDETNPFLAAKKIHNFVVRHITYDASAVTPWKPETEGALFALRSGRGMCRHFAALSTALARAAGIPTADIWGSAASPIDKGDQKHNWVHYYVPNYGWVPAEPTLEKGSRLDCFARLPNNRDIPVMSVSYTYRRAWWSGGTVDKPFSGEEPIILEGFQVSEFSGSTAALLTFAMVAVCLIMRREPRRQTSAKKS